MASLYLVRHGQASFGAEDYDQLSELGVTQSGLLGDWMQSCQLLPDKVVVGGMKRHAQTAEACLNWLAPETSIHQPENWVVDPGFAEFDHQDVLVKFQPECATRAGLASLIAQHPEPRKAFQQLFSQAVTRWVSGEHDRDYVETWPAFQQRCQTALAELMASAGEARNIWVFTSGGPISAMLQPLLGIPDARIFDLNWMLLNTGVTRLLFGKGRTSVSYFNAVGHLELAQDSNLLTYR